MDFIIVYDKRAEGNPIVAMHSQRFDTPTVDLRDIHPEDDPDERGVVVVPGEVAARMTTYDYQLDADGNPVQEPVLQEVTRDLTSIMDLALGQNILVFGEPVEDVVQVVDVLDQPVQAELANAAKGVITIGSASGLLSVTARVRTGRSHPVIVGEHTNWQWERDADGNITGLTLLDANEPQPPAGTGAPQ